MAAMSRGRRAWLMQPEESRSVLPTLGEGLKDEYVWVRTPCVQAPGNLGNRTALTKALSDPCHQVRYGAQRALEAIAGKTQKK